MLCYSFAMYCGSTKASINQTILRFEEAAREYTRLLSKVTIGNGETLVVQLKTVIDYSTSFVCYAWSK